MTFLTGLLTGLLVSVAGVYFQRLSVKRKAQEEVLFRVYMLLIELNGTHFWIASRQIRGEAADREHAKKFHDLAWQIADLLRQLDKLPELSAIATVIFGLQFPSEQARSNELNRLLKAIGHRVNPRYNAAMQKISSENTRLMAEDTEQFFQRKKQIWPM